MLTYIITARYLDYRDEVEFFQCLQRAAANPIVLGEAGDPRKMYMIGDFGDYLKRQGRVKDSLVLFKHVIGSNLIPADMYRFYLAESCNINEEYEGVGDILKYLYCKRVFEADPDFLTMFEENNGVCLREATYDILTRVAIHYIDTGDAFKNKGDALKNAGDHAGNYFQPIIYPLPTWVSSSYASHVWP